MPTTRVYASQSHANLGVALQSIVRFLIDDHGAITGPRWSLIEAYSQGQAQRATPTNPNDLDSLTSASNWYNSTIVTGSWVVLESRNANNSNHFQLYIEYDTTTVLNFMMIPHQNFVTGGTAVTPPLFPTTSYGNTSGTFSTLTNANLTGNGTYSVVADEGMAAFMMEGGTSNVVAWMFAGELDSTMSSGSFSGDDRAYTLYRTNTGVDWGTTSPNARFGRISPFDNQTYLTGGSPSLWGISSGGTSLVLHDGLGQDVFSQDVFPVGLFFNDLSHRHWMGWFRNCYSVHADLVKSGTIATQSGTFMYRSNGATPPQIALTWNSQSYGSASLGTLQELPQINRTISGSAVFYTLETDTAQSVLTQTLTVNNVPTGTYDLNRIRITYPSSRRRPRYGNISG